MNSELYALDVSAIDAMSDKDDFLAIFLWERLLSMEGIPEGVRTYANEVIALYRARLDVGGDAGGNRAQAAEDDDGNPDELGTWGVNIMLKHFIWDLEDIERLGVSDEARSRIARCIRIYNESIVE